MKNPLLALSKTFYILSFTALFLPTFIPSCSSKNETAVSSDTLTVAVDPSTISIDTVAAISTEAGEVHDEEVSSDERSIIQPDGQNFSFWGYLLFSVDEGLIWIFVSVLFYSGILKFWNKGHKTSAILSIVGFSCLTAVDKEKIVWGFWVIYVVYSILTVINVVHYYQERKKLLLNKP